MKKYIFTTLLTLSLPTSLYATCEGWLTFTGKKATKSIVEKGFTQESDGFWYDAVGRFHFTKEQLHKVSISKDTTLKLVPRVPIDDNTCRYDLRGDHHHIGHVTVGRVEEAADAEEAMGIYTPPEKTKKIKDKHRVKPERAYKGFKHQSSIHHALVKLLDQILKIIPGIEAIVRSIDAEDIKTGTDLVMGVVNLGTSIAANHGDGGDKGAIWDATKGVLKSGSPALASLQEKKTLFEAHYGEE